LFVKLPRSFAFDRLEASAGCRAVHRAKALRAKLDYVCPVVKQRAVLPDYEVGWHPNVAVDAVRAGLMTANDLE
jgi:hypothetical protein